MRRIAIMPGHRFESPGHKGLRPIDMSEWQFFVKIFYPYLQKFAARKNIEMMLFDKSCKSAFATGSMVDTWLEASKKKAAFELHFSNGTSAEFGTKTLYETDENKHLAEITHAKVCEVFKRTYASGDLGIEKLKPGERPHYPLLCVKSPIVIVETCFAASNPVEATLLWSRKETLAKAFVEAAAEFMK